MFKQGWLAVGLTAASTVASAQQYIVHEGTPIIVGTVMPAPMIQYAPAPVFMAAPCCAPTATYVADQHQTRPIEGCNECVCTTLPFAMVCNGKCPDVCTSTDISPKPGGALPPVDCPSSKFYNCDKPFTCKKDTPHIQECCNETYHFKEWKEEKECCTITTCVPCKIEVCKSKKCVLAPYNVAFLARRRTATGRWDVYANNVPGMPSTFLWMKDVGWAQVHQEFPSCVPQQEPPCP